MQQDVFDELFPLSWISQYGYCPRRCGLLALEQAWHESADTIEGANQHERVHTSRVERRGPLVEIFEMSVFSRRIGVSGKCDCVELRESDEGVPLPYGNDRYLLYPIEYKHGPVRNEHEYNLQLCAQAMCLEEMFGCKISEGAIFYIQSRRRETVCLDANLRDETLSVARCIRDVLHSQKVPFGAFGPKCKKCSMADYCEPALSSNATNYCENVWLNTLRRNDI